MANIQALIEGILFTMGEPVPVGTLAAALEIPLEEAREQTEALQRRYQEEDRGLQIIRLEDSYQICAKESCYEPLIRIVSRPKRPALTDVLMETLAIIAYRQPVTKAEIERIRGVSSDHAVNRLVEYGLVEETGRLSAPGRPALFATTQEFLRRFRLEELGGLPELTADQRIELEEAAEEARGDAEPEQKDLKLDI